MKVDKKQVVNIIVYTAMSVLTVLFIIGIFVGSNDISEEDRAEKEQAESENEVHQYSPNERDQEDEDTGPSPEELEQLEEGEIWEEHEELDEIQEQEINESELPPSYEEIYGEEDVEASRKIVEKFIEIIHEVDGTQPMKHIEDSKEYITEGLYERLQEDYKQGQMAWTYGVLQKYKSSEIYEPATTRVNDGIVWAVNVKGTIQYHDDEEKDKTDIYLIHLKKIDDEYKVDDYYVNVPT